MPRSRLVLRHATTANYLNDLWVFDTQEYKWKQVEFKENERKPSYVLIIIDDERVLTTYMSYKAT